MIDEPVAGSPSPPRLPIPWEDRQRLGRVLAFVETLRLFALTPQEGFARMRERGDLASPLLWGVLCAWLGVVAAQFWSLALGPLAWLPLLPGALRQEWTGSVVALIFGLVATPLLALVGLFVSAAIVHLFLWMFGALADSRAGYEGTLRVVAYSSMAQVANVVPIVGWLAVVGWTLTLQVLGLVRVHRTTPGRAVAAVLMPALLCCAALLFFLATVVALVAGAIVGAGGHRP
jgi:hypothetical protein